MPWASTPSSAASGVALSGAAQPRSIARALYRQPQILFLDETFDQLDLVRSERSLTAKATRGNWLVIVSTDGNGRGVDRIVQLAPAEATAPTKTAPAGAASRDRPGLFRRLDSEDAGLRFQGRQALVDRRMRELAKRGTATCRGRRRADKVDAAPRDRAERQRPCGFGRDPDRLDLEVTSCPGPVGVSVLRSKRRRRQGDRCGEKEGVGGFHGESLAENWRRSSSRQRFRTD